MRLGGVFARKGIAKLHSAQNGAKECEVAGPGDWQATELGTTSMQVHVVHGGRPPARGQTTLGQVDQQPNAPETPSAEGGPSRHKRRILGKSADIQQ